MTTRALQAVVGFGVLSGGEVIHADPEDPRIAALIGQNLLRIAPWALVPDEETLVDLTVTAWLSAGLRA